MMLRRLFPAVFAASALVSAAMAQSPTFEVATIHPAAPPKFDKPDAIRNLHIGMKVDAARVDIGFMSLRDLIVTAYRIKPFQLMGPDWMVSERFDILATLPEGASKDQVPEMLQGLLAERFGLKVRHENKEMPVYAMTLAKGGPKFKESAPDADTPPAETKPAEAKPDGGGRGPIVIGVGDQQISVKQAGRGGVQISGGPTGSMTMSMNPAAGTMHMELQKMTMARFAEMLTPMVDRPVLDRTGLQGNYQLTLDLAMGDMIALARTQGAIPIPAGAPIGGGPGPGGGFGGPLPGAPGGLGAGASDPSGGSIFQAVQQLGLKLDKDKAPFDTIVVEHIEKTPTEN